MKRILLLAFMACIAVYSFAQSMVKGKVYDESTRNPLSGATITVAGKNVATTGQDGTFSFNCSKPVSITITFVGYESHQQVVSCSQEVNIGLVVSGSTLDNVDLTATSAQNKSLLSQPVSITKLSQAELKRGNGLFLDDAINSSVPGVTMNRRAVSSGQQFNIRGYGNGSRGTRGTSSNFDGQGYKVYLNGIPVTDAEGITTLDDIDYSSVGNVEVVKGPAGTLYGLAIAGVVNLHTAKPAKGKTNIGQEIMLGNYGLQRYTTHFQTATDKSSLLVNYGHQVSEGYTIHNNSKKDFVNVAGEFQPNAKQSIMAYFGYSNSYDQRSGELTVQQYQSGDFSGNIEYIKRNAHSQVYTTRAGLGHTYTFNSHIANTTTVFATGFNSNASSAGGWSDKSATNLGVRSTFDTKFTAGRNATLSGITGVETQRQNAQTVGYTMVKDPRDPNAVWEYGNPYYWILGSSTSNVYTQTATTSLFTEWTLALPMDFSITGGIGFSNMKISLDDRFYVANKPSHFDTTYKSMVSPHFALNKIFKGNISVYAAYSRGYKAPVSSFFYIPWSASNSATGVVNNHLKPEFGDQFEVGTKGALLQNRLNYQLALFDAQFKNKMTTVSVPNPSNTATLYSYVVNGGKQDHMGVEVFVKYNVIKSGKKFFTIVAPFVNFTYSDYEYKNFEFQTGTTTTNFKSYVFSGYPVVGVSKVVSSEGIDVNTRCGLYGNIVHLYRDKMPVTAPDSVYAPSYNLLNAKLGFQKDISAHFSIDASFGVNNIGGTKYPIMVFVNQIPDAFIAGPAKANYFAALKIDYNF